MYPLPDSEKKSQVWSDNKASRAQMSITAIAQYTFCAIAKVVVIPFCPSNMNLDTLH